MNRNDFSDSTTGRVVKVGKEEAAYWAFVPNSLPPSLSANWQLSKLISQADRSLSELAGLGRTLPNPDLLVAPFLRREAVLSSRIEGTQSGIDDLYLYEAGQLPLPGMEGQHPTEADVREVFNYVVALKFGLNRLDVLPVSLRLIRETHKVLMQGVRGEHATPGKFRTRQNWIGGTTINNAVYVPPPVEEMQVALDSFEKYIHAKEDVYPPLVRLAFIHYQFEAIHPFVDGNGRLGRLLLILLMVNWNLLPLPLLYLSAYFERNRQTYYDLLLNVSQKGAWEEWTVFFLRGLQEQALDAILRIKKLQDLQAQWMKKLNASRASASALRLTDRLFESPIITIPQAQQRLGLSYRAAKQTVDKLVKLKILSLYGNETYGKKYVAQGIFAAIADNS